MSKSEGLMPPVHPGEVLREDFMKPLGLTVNRLALELHVPATRIGEIVHERRRITAETWKLQGVLARSPRLSARCTLRLPWCPETVHGDRECE